VLAGRISRLARHHCRMDTPQVKAQTQRIFEVTDRAVAAETRDCALDSLPSAEGPAKTPWINRWEFERGGKRWRVAVQVWGSLERAHKAAVPIEEGSLGYDVVDYHRLVETVDAREWIESMGDRERWPDGTKFRVVIEDVTKGS